MSQPTHKPAEGERQRHWDERYRGGANLDRAASPLLIRAIHGRRPGRALEIAAGAGRNSLFLASQGWKVTAVDVSPVAIAILRERSGSLNVNAITADLEAGQFNIDRNSYDLICDFYYLQRDLFNSIRDGIVAGGVFVGSIHLHDDSPDVQPMNPEYLLHPGELREIFKDWTIAEYREGRPEDSDHDRLTADIIATKP